MGPKNNFYGEPYGSDDDDISYNPVNDDFETEDGKCYDYMKDDDGNGYLGKTGEWHEDENGEGYFVEEPEKEDEED